ncbi:uncharacterized protein LOC116842667 [Odontomachus brunneus]|uniref:uncharacterized protein LOC116842667 n=1 Tax=Odontomachus brunneus TaxID=486640 RepID=UPI0013F1E826|nr:uncharacterized protein LOC116842667 [Odontomachus brunneus]
MEQSFITTRAKAQKLISLNESMTKSRDENKRSVRGKRSVNVKSNSEVTTGQSTRKKTTNAKSTLSKSKKKKASSRNFNIVKGAESESKAHKNESCNESKRLSRSNANVSTIQSTDDNLFQWTDSADLNKTPKKVQQKMIVPSVNEQSGMVTPKSTPIKLSLTPHRSTKTPKKSPVSLSSPKTHSVSVSRLLKTPRKLSLTPGENLYNNDSSNKLRKAEKDSLRGMSKERSPASSVTKSKRVMSSAKLKGITHRFSKSPKIVLRSPSKKSPKSNVSAHKRKRPSKRSFASSGTSPSLGESSSDSRNLSADKHRLLNSKLAKLLTASQMRDVLAEPVVLLRKLSLDSKSDTLTIAAGSNRLNRSIDAESSTSAEASDASAGESSRRSFAAKTTNRSAGKLSSPTRGENKTPLMSSTPQEEKTPLARANPIFDTSTLSVVQDDTAYPNTRSRYTNQSGIYAALAIQDVSKMPSLLDVDISENVGDTHGQAHAANTAQQDTVHDVDQVTELNKSQNSKRDVTYELKDPQTPGLRQMIRKRTAVNAADANLPSAKKFCRVRFANIGSDGNSVHNSISKSIGNRQSSVTRNSGVQRNIAIMNSAHKSKRIEIRKFSHESLASPLNAKSSSRMSTSRGRLHSFNAASLSLGKIQATPKRLESVGKNSEKRSSVKKVPNFKRMHEKMFAKSESVVDAKKRLESRHLEFATKKVLSEVDAKKGMKLLPSDTSNGTYNRFGFKLRKAEATHVILKKQTVFSRQKQQHETRTVLKSVRTNRRFELQMKARNINPI